MKIRTYVLVFLVCFCGCNSSEDRNDKQNILAPKDTTLEAVERRATSFYEQDDYLGAIKYFTILINRDSTNGKFYFRRGYCYSRIIKKKMAICDFGKAIVFHFKEASAYYNIGLNYSYENDSLALQYFEKCIAFDPSFADAYVEIKDCRKRLEERKNSMRSPK